MKESIVAQQVSGEEEVRAMPDARNADAGAVHDRRTGGDRRQVPDVKIAWLDVQRGLKRFGGDNKSYMAILRSFASGTRSLLAVVRNTDGDNLGDYAIAVHGIKGSSRGICADLVGNMAEALENAAKSGDVGFVRAHNQDFLKTVEELIAYIDNVLATMNEENPKPRRNKPDGETLAAILAACKEYDMDGVDAAMEEMEKFEYESGSELVAWLRTNVEQMNFTQIEEKLSALTGNVESVNGNGQK